MDTVHVLSGGVYERYGRGFYQPSVLEDDLFLIFETAVKQKNLVIASADANTQGVYNNHAYAITDTFKSNGTKIIKLHNPHNIPDDIKR